MGQFAIMRIAKHSDAGQIVRLARHHLRAAPVANADPARPIRVLAGADTAAAVVGAIDAATRPLARRRDAVRCVDVLMTASPEWFAGGGSVEAFSERAMAWLRGAFGAENVVTAVLHLDETTPHVQALVTPIDPAGKLRVGHWVGSPQKLRALQDGYAAAMAPLGLRRGKAGSRARHEELAAWYGDLAPRMDDARRTIEGADAVRRRQDEEQAEIDAQARALAGRGEVLAAERSRLQRALDGLGERERDLREVGEALLGVADRLPANDLARLAGAFDKLRPAPSAPPAAGAKRSENMFLNHPAPAKPAGNPRAKPGGS